MVNNLPLYLRSPLDRLIEQAQERGYDRADLIKYLKNPSAPLASSRGRGRPPKDKNRLELACRVAAHQLIGDSLWQAREAVAREISAPDENFKSVAKRIRRRLNKRPKIQSYFELAIYELGCAVWSMKVTNWFDGQDSEPGREALRRFGKAFAAAQDLDNPLGWEKQCGDEFQRLADEQLAKPRAILHVRWEGRGVDIDPTDF